MRCAVQLCSEDRPDVLDDRVAHALKRDVPLWAIASLFGLLAVLAFMGMRWALERQTQADLAGYAQLITLAPQPANITITLP